MSNLSLAAPVIFGCSGCELTDWERSFFSDVQPLGFILFARNIENRHQVKSLTMSLREIVGRANAPILVDQEGGRVRRLRPPLCREIRPAQDFGAIAANDLEKAKRAVYVNHRLIADELMSFGFNVDCAPLIDLRFPWAHEVIGDRAFGADVDLVAALGRSAARGLMDGGVTPVIKHIPGHGRATVDSHHALPRVTAGVEELRQTDFAPFRMLADMPWAMTAHVVYEAIDARLPASLSRDLITQIIRTEIGFRGLLICDDLSMKALSGDLTSLARDCLKAGCDIVLHCNGDADEMRSVARGAVKMSSATVDRFEKGASMLKDKTACDDRQFAEELAQLLA